MTTGVNGLSTVFVIRVYRKVQSRVSSVSVKGVNVEGHKNVSKNFKLSDILIFKMDNNQTMSPSLVNLKNVFYVCKKIFDDLSPG